MTTEELKTAIKSILDYFEKHIEQEDQLKQLVVLVLQNIHKNIDANPEESHAGLIGERYQTILQDIFPVGEEVFRKLANQTYMASKCLKRPIPPTPSPSELDIFYARKRYKEQLSIVGMGNIELAQEIMGRYA